MKPRVRDWSVRAIEVVPYDNASLRRLARLLQLDVGCDESMKGLLDSLGAEVLHDGIIGKRAADALTSGLRRSPEMLNMEDLTERLGLLYWRAQGEARRSAARVAEHTATNDRNDARNRTVKAILPLLAGLDALYSEHMPGNTARLSMARREFLVAALAPRGLTLSRDALRHTLNRARALYPTGVV